MFDQAQVTTSSTVPKALWGQNATHTFSNTIGSVNDPIPFVIKNEDSTNLVWYGGPTVTAGTGQSLAPGASITIQLVNQDVLWVIAGASTPVVSVVAGRQ